MSKFLKIIVNLVVIAAIAVAAALLVPPFVGVDTVMNDNTETETNLPIGSVAYGRSTDVDDLEVGDRIIYSEGSSDYIYEITDMDASAGVYKVSDPYNNNSDTQNITIQKSIPKVAVVIPFIGYGAIAGCQSPRRGCPRPGPAARPAGTPCPWDGPPLPRRSRPPAPR